VSVSVSVGGRQGCWPPNSIEEIRLYVGDVDDLERDEYSLNATFCDVLEPRTSNLEPRTRTRVSLFASFSLFL